ncbi:IclR family transcriptional regulator [Embleya sp. NPDC059237]|uniref:IclR family transcriptional regulator n=1 Tax=Embleya sp. NPDC059237 TaxID=3346784 RepID=UPI0036B0CA77
MDDHTVTGRVIAVLDAVAAQRTPVSLAELTRRTTIPKPTVRRIAHDLVRRRLLDRCGHRYRLGSRLLDLGMRAAAQQGLHRIGTPHVQDLFARTGEIVWINTFTDTALTLVGTAFGANRAQDVRRGGWPLPIDSPAFPNTAAGRVLMTRRPDLVEHLRARPPAPLTRYAAGSWARLDAAVDVVRDTGTAIEQEQCLLGYSCVATGLHAPDGELVGMIGITGRIGSFDAHRAARPLRSAALDIDRAFAATHAAPSAEIATIGR